MSKKLATVVIDIDDVRKAGGVEAAINEFCRQSDTVSSGVVGMEFATSGPGPGWSKQYGVDEWSLESFRGGAMAYVDTADGRVRRAEPVADGDTDSETMYDMAGDGFLPGDWSDDSEVYVECPSEEDALEWPEKAAEMARSVIDYHHALSNVAEWRQLAAKIAAAAEAFDGIDPDQFPEG